MNEHDPVNMNQRARERLLYQYTCAVERGDFECVIQILAQAAADPVLEQRILEVSETTSARYATVGEEDAHLVRQLLLTYLPSGVPTDEEQDDLPQLTVGDVAARIRADAVATGQTRHEGLLAERIQNVETPLPTDLSQRGVRQLLDGLGIAMNDGFRKVFRETAILLSMGRQQGQASLAATRQQRRQGRPHTDDMEAR